LISSVNPDPKAEVVMTGGVAKNIAIVQLLQRMLGKKISVPENPQIITAMGAALLARKLED
jgi:activator of 2-hydroxyglutaryl-CoA dehydratase